MGLLSGKINDPAAGRESRSAFIAQAAFWFAAFKFLVSGVSLKIWSQQISLGTTDAALLGAFLLPCLSLYWARRRWDAPRQESIKNPIQIAEGGPAG
jgi:hypothetical protein